MAQSMSINPKQSKNLKFFECRKKKLVQKCEIKKNVWQVPWKTVTKKQNGGQVCWEQQHLNLKFRLVLSLHKTIRFHVAARLFSNRSHKTSKCGEDVSNTHSAIVCHFFCSYHILTSSVIHQWTDVRSPWEIWVQLSLVAEHIFQVPMPNSPLLLNYLWFGARFFQ